MVQIFQRRPKEHRPSFGERVSAGIGAGLETLNKYAEEARLKKEMEEENAAIKRLGVDVSGIHDPKIRQQYVELAQQGKNKGKEFQDKITQNQQTINALEDQYELPRGKLSGFVNDPKLAQKVVAPKKKTQASQPIDPEQLNIIQNVRNTPGYNDMDEVDQYRALTNSGVSKENAEVESKLTGQKLDRKQKEVESAYKAQENFINDTTSSYKGFETEMKPRLLQMQHIPDEDLINPTAAVFLESLGIPLGALEDPSSELYNKLSQDLLKGLPETYGSRILKVEVENFLKTIPTLMNSPDGRRMIASNMLKLGEMKEVYYNEMRRQQRDGLDSGKPLPRDFQQRVFDQVKPQIDRINNEFLKLSEIKAVPEGTIPFFNPNGEVQFVPKEHAQWAQENGGRRIW